MLVAMRHWIALLLAACGGASAPVESPKVDASTFAATAFLDAVQQHDATKIAGMLGPDLKYGGLLFSDPSCTTQFPAARTLPADTHAAFAACLAQLPLAASTRKDAFPNVAVLEYAPGIEIEVEFGFTADRAWIEWIGYSGRQDLHDALPTITATALDALRTGPRETISATDVATYDHLLDGIHGHELHVWLKVCADADGNVTSVHAREATTLEVIEPFVAMAKTWKLTGPFKVGDTPIPVCALERLSYPDKSATTEVLPQPLDDSGEVRVSPVAFEAHRTDGYINIVPSDDDKIILQKNGSPKIVGSFKICMDETGAVASVKMLRSTRLRGYDDKITRTIQRTWKYSPFLLNGQPKKVCTAVTFIYAQR